MAVETTWALTVNTVETLETNLPAATAAANRKVSHTGYSSGGIIKSDSSVPATKCAYFEQALTAGAATVDLTALTGSNGATVNLTGLKVQILKIKAKATNANPITIGEGASNGYEALGNAWQIILKPGQEVAFVLVDQAPDVGSGAKTIDLAGTGTQSVEFAIVAG